MLTSRLGSFFLCREVMSDVFLSSSSDVSTKSALFVAWGQLLVYDLSLTRDNASEPFDVPCNAVGGEGIDVWCPLGAASEGIPFFRSGPQSCSLEGRGFGPLTRRSIYILRVFVRGTLSDNYRNTSVVFRRGAGICIWSELHVSPSTLCMYVVLSYSFVLHP